jgi:hypothetical protein
MTSGLICLSAWKKWPERLESPSARIPPNKVQPAMVLKRPFMRFPCPYVRQADFAPTTTPFYLICAVITAPRGARDAPAPMKPAVRNGETGLLASLNQTLSG